MKILGAIQACFNAIKACLKFIFTTREKDRAEGDEDITGTGW